MKKFDILWPLGVVLIVFVLTMDAFADFSQKHIFISSYIKFALLAPMGELLVGRISNKEWKLPAGFIFRVLLWGVYGMSVSLAFKLFEAGTVEIMKNGIIIGHGNKYLTAFFISTFMNLTFGPAMMATHKITDKFIDYKCGEKRKNCSILDAVRGVDWYGFITFVVFKTEPFFWIPAHTIVFIMPAEYRIIVAALLSIALGVISSVATVKKAK